MIYFLQGFTLGLAYVAPIGMQNLFVINSALTQPRLRVYQTAFIVIFFDCTLALACFFGIGALMDQFRLLRMAVLLVGSIVVMIIGYKLTRSKDQLDTSTDVSVPIRKVIAMACVVTWFNPQALIDGSLMLGAFKATLPPASSAEFIIGVMVASATWFLSVSTIGTLFSNKFTDKVLRVINIICGVVILCYGIKLGWSFIQML